MNKIENSYVIDSCRKINLKDFQLLDQVVAFDDFFHDEIAEQHHAKRNQ